MDWCRRERRDDRLGHLPIRRPAPASISLPNTSSIRVLWSRPHSERQLRRVRIRPRADRKHDVQHGVATGPPKESRSSSQRVTRRCVLRRTDSRQSDGLRFLLQLAAASGPVRPRRNGLASTPYNVAVGGTDFNDIGTQTLYWSTANSTGQVSAMKYIPEDVWNDSCTNSLLFSLVTVTPPISTPVGSCSDLTIQDNNLVRVAGGGGGKSNCTNKATTIPAAPAVTRSPPGKRPAGVPGTTRNLPDFRYLPATASTATFTSCATWSSRTN